MLRGLAVLVAIAAALAAAVPGHALNPEGELSATQVAERLAGDEIQVAEARQAADALQAAPRAQGLVPQLRQQLQVAEAGYAYRQSIRAEEDAIYQVAGDRGFELEVVSHFNASFQSKVDDSVRALLALWRLAGIGDVSDIHPYLGRHATSGLPAQQLEALYRQAAAAYGMDWTYLAAINFVESDFGRVLGPSSAGALGPMQFEPATWSEYGRGDIMNPHDSIFAAARYLSASGAPADMADAVYSYNPSWDYVEAITRFAHVMRGDASWLDRYYYWNTTG